MSEPIGVLHVDDEPDFAEMTADFLEREDDRIEVGTETRVNDGLDRLATEEFACIISDYDMPGMDGLAFLEQVRDTDDDLPFILFTGKGSEEVASEAFSAGATDYLQKEVGTDQYAILANRIVNSVETARAKRQRQRQLDALETAQDGISILDEDGQFLYVNEAYADLYGYDPVDMIGEHWALIYSDDDVDFVREEILPTVTEEGCWRGETTGLRADGTTFSEDHTLATTDNGELICTVRDISPRKERERQLHTLHEATRDMVAAATRQEVADIASEMGDDILDVPVNIHLYDEDADGLVPVAVSPKTQAVLGTPPTIQAGEGVAWRVFESGDPGIYDDVRTAPGVFNSETPIRSECCLPLGDHGVLLAASTTVGAFDESDISLLKILAANVETAFDRARREQELRTRERELQHQNDRLDEFASVVSHDLRNPLNVAEGHLELAEETGDTEHFEAIARAQNRMDGIIEDVLTLAQLGDAVGETRSIALDTVARRAWNNVETGTATLEIDSDRTIDGDASRVVQLFENLFRNAIDHGDDDVTVRVGWLEGRAGVYVDDTGPGISSEERARIFESGYTTESDGTGLGLAIVEEIADGHGWEIDCTDGEEGGARFEITFESGNG